MKVGKRTIFEIVLIVIIFAEGYSIYWLCDLLKDQQNFKVNSLSEGYVNAHKLSLLEELDEKSDFEGVLSYGEKLINNGWGNDKFVLRLMAKANYAINNKEESIKFFEKAIAGEYLSELYRPVSGQFQGFEEAVERYNLADLYEEMGNTSKAQTQRKEAFKIAKVAMGDKYDEAKFIQLCENSSFVK